MFPWISVLAVLGLVLILAEILMPGFGLFGIFGILSLLVVTILTAQIYGVVAFFIMLIVLILLFTVFILFAKKSGLYNKVILHDKQDEQDFDESKLEGLLGKTGVTQTTLRPFGTMDIDGSSVDVCSLGDFIDRGKTVKIVLISGKTVTVKEVD